MTVAEMVNELRRRQTKGDTEAGEIADEMELRLNLDMTEEHVIGINNCFSRAWRMCHQ